MIHRTFFGSVSLITVFALAVTGYSPALVAPPSNDDFANAEPITSLPFGATVDITEADIEADENQFLCTDVQRSVWFVFMPTTSMTVNINVTGGSVSSALGGVYQAGGGGFNGLSVLRCAYSSNPPINLQLTANETYYIQVASYSEEVGSIQINLEQIPSPANDNFADATPIDSLPFNATTPLTAATFESSEPQPCYNMDRSVWYSFTPSENMTIQADLQGSNFSNTNVNIYRSLGSSSSELEFLTCSIFNLGTGIVTVEAGQIYYFQAGNAFGDSGTLTFNVTQLIPPSNDNFADAIQISSLPYSTNFDSAPAGLESDEPQSCGVQMERSVWFRFTPTDTVSVRLDTQGTVISNLVSIFRATGPEITDLEFTACKNNSLSIFEAVAGETYYLQVGTSGGSGNIQLNLQEAFPPANDLFATAEPVISLPLSATIDITDAWNQPNEPQPCFMNKTAWYVFTPSETMALRASVSVSAASGGYLTVYESQGEGITDLVYVGCTGSNNDRAVSFLAEAGQTYYLQVGDFFEDAVTVQFDLVQIFPPANDTFAGAEPVTTLPFSATVDVTDAWTESNESQYCSFMSRTIWYAFVPTEDMAVRVRTPNSGSNGDNLTVYRSQGTGLVDQVFMGCTSNNGQFTFLAQAGQTYYLQVGNSDAPIDTVQFDLVQLNPPANDNFANAESIDTLPFSTMVQRPTDATLESEEQQWCYFMEWTAWYAFTPTETMVLTASTEGSTASSNINVYRDVGSGLSGLNVLGCTALDGPVTFVAETGQTYYLQAGTVFGEIGDVLVNLDRATPPANDYFADAETIGSLPVDLTLDIRGAGTETGEPQFCSNNDKTAWYALTASEDMFIALSTQGTNFDHNVGIYQATGTTISELQFLTCIGSAGGAFHVQAGETYFLQAGAIFAGLGNYQLQLTQVFPPANDNFADAIDITALPFSNTADLSDAFTEFGEPQFCYSTSTTVWYSFTPSATIRVRLNSEGGSLLPNVNVFHATGSGFENMQAMLCSGGSEDSFLAVAGETYYFQVGGFGEDGTAQFNLEEIPAILGRITDSVTGDPLSGNESPFAVAVLYQVCGDGCLQSVSQQGADDNGLIYFDGVSFGTTLPPGEYVIEAIASQYIRRQFGHFTFTGSRLDVGDMPLDPPAVIRGRAVDSATGVALPDTYVYLRRCDVDGCSEYVNEQSVDGDGVFHFNSFYYGAPLTAGTYELEFAVNLFQPKKIQMTIANGENRDLGDVLIEPFGTIGSISGRVVDALTGRPIPEGAGPTAVLYRCDPDCSPVNGMPLEPDGRFRFENDYDGNRLLPGAYKVSAVADQYETHLTESFDVTDDEHKDIGDVELRSYPVRFSELQACEDIPATGGECSFRIRITNGTNQWMIGRAWSIVYAEMPGTVFGYTKFEARDAQLLGLRPGASRTFGFKFDVPANTNPEGSLICTRIYVGQGLIGPSLNPVGVWEAFCIVRNGAEYEIVSPDDAISAVQSSMALEATATESEPNNSCQSAQDVGTFTDTLVLNGILDSSEAPDVDFYRFSAAPGELVSIDLEGQATGKGTLGDPLLGFFDSNCNLVAINDDSGSLNSKMELTVPDDGIFIIAATYYPDSGFNGGGNGSYQLTLSLVKTIASISGTATDAVTGKVLRGDAAPFAYVYLSLCGPFSCPIVNSVQADSDGRFRFETDSNGAPLPVGEYSIFIIADQYEPGETGNFTVAEGQHFDAGNVPLQSYPVRFSDVKPCSAPSEGSICDFSVRISNGLSTRFTGRAWSMIEASGMGSFIEFTEFQTDTWQDLDLRPGRSTVLRFRFLVRGSVDDGATICATTFAGQKPNPFFGAAGQHFLFCIQKGTDGFTLMSPTQTHEMQRKMELQPLSGPESVIEKPK